MIDIAYAQGCQAGQGGGAGDMIWMMGIMFAIFWLLVFRPQQKKQKEHQEMIDNLKKGDQIITNGGIYGRVHSTDEATLRLEIAEKVRIKIARGYVAGLANPPKPAEKKEKSKDKAKK